MIHRAWHSTFAFYRRSEQFRFLVIGIYNTAFGYIVFVGCYLLFSAIFHYLAILVIAHFAAVINAFIGHRWLVFQSKGPILVEFLRFNVSYLGILGFSLLTLPVLVEITGLHVLVAQAILIVITVISSYFAHRNFSFRRPAASRNHPPQP